MIEIWAYSLVSVILVSFVSFAGIFLFAINLKKLEKLLIYLVSFSVGALLGDAFIHLLPEIIEEAGFGLDISLYLLFGLLFSFIIEKFIRWRHCHVPTSKHHPHPFAIMNLVGDGVHNFIDGIIISVSYLVSIPVGISTTLAVIFHEIPQEIGDFGVLIHGGFSKTKALFFNFLTAATAILGGVVGLIASVYVEHITYFLIPFAAGNFIYIAGSDLIPELHKKEGVKESLLQLLAVILGIGVMMLLLLLE
ncbi:ZIP family metal transporter [Candidatus Woesearchaeota archaeon CG10_big_fil_rev_8_21_14_0_10_30_7]|nr:MAG: ZIP family metal transporter [Candidatus Woesearchaeota archaeon CG10_big_fil_rev_8_21_14_0_10_30_7]